MIVYFSAVLLLLIETVVHSLPNNILFFSALPYDFHNGFQEKHIDTCTRNGYKPTSNSVLLSSSLESMVWNSTSFASVVSSIQNATVGSPVASECCSASAWCVWNNGHGSCFGSGFGSSYYVNYGWQLNTSMTPIYTCESATSSLTARVSNMPYVSNYSIVLSPSYTSPRLRIDGRFGTSASELSVRVQESSCGNIDVCQNTCKSCYSDFDCGEDKVCMLFDGPVAPGKCLRTCNYDYSCPCGGQCYKVTLTRDGKFAYMCANPGITNQIQLCQRYQWGPSILSGYTDRIECSLPKPLQSASGSRILHEVESIEVSSVVSGEDSSLTLLSPFVLQGTRIDSPDVDRAILMSPSKENSLVSVNEDSNLRRTESRISSRRLQTTDENMTRISDSALNVTNGGNRYNSQLCGSSNEYFPLIVERSSYSSVGISAAIARDNGITIGSIIIPPRTVDSSPFSSLPVTGYVPALKPMGLRVCRDDSDCPTLDACSVPTCSISGCCKYTASGICGSSGNAATSASVPGYQSMLLLPSKLSVILPLPVPPNGGSRHAPVISGGKIETSALKISKPADTDSAGIDLEIDESNQEAERSRSSGHVVDSSTFSIVDAVFKAASSDNSRRLDETPQVVDPKSLWNPNERNPSLSPRAIDWAPSAVWFDPTYDSHRQWGYAYFSGDGVFSSLTPANMSKLIPLTVHQMSGMMQCPVYSLSAASQLDTSPLVEFDLDFPFTFYEQRLEKLWVSPDGFVRSIPRAPCRGSFRSTGCDFSNDYAGVVSPLIADFDPRGWEESEIYVGSNAEFFEYPPALNDDEDDDEDEADDDKDDSEDDYGENEEIEQWSSLDDPLPISWKPMRSACVTYSRLAQHETSSYDPKALPSPAFSTHMCLFSDGAVRMRTGSVFGSTVPPVWNASSLPPASSKPRLPALSGVRSISSVRGTAQQSEASILAQGVFPPFRSPAAAALATGDLLALRSQEIVLSREAQRAATTVGVCAVAPTACMRGACVNPSVFSSLTPTSVPPRVELQWNGVGCGPGFEGLDVAAATARLHYRLAKLALARKAELVSNGSPPDSLSVLDIPFQVEEVQDVLASARGTPVNRSSAVQLPQDAATAALNGPWLECLFGHTAVAARWAVSDVEEPFTLRKLANSSRVRLVCPVPPPPSSYEGENDLVQPLTLRLAVPTTPGALGVVNNASLALDSTLGLHNASQGGLNRLWKALASFPPGSTSGLAEGAGTALEAWDDRISVVYVGLGVQGAFAVPGRARPANISQPATPAVDGNPWSVVFQDLMFSYSQECYAGAAGAAQCRPRSWADGLLAPSSQLPVPVCDDCGLCGVTSSSSSFAGVPPSSFRDCAGVCRGSARLDACGVCAGGATDRVPNADLDCNGVCFGPGTNCPQDDPDNGDNTVVATTFVVVALFVCLSVIFTGLAYFGWAAFVRSRLEDLGPPPGAVTAAAAEPVLGLTPQQIALLPVMSYAPPSSSNPPSGDGNTSEIASENCAICMDAFEAGDKVRPLPACSHVFHAACIDEWFSRASVCPVCRADQLSSPLFAESIPDQDMILAAVARFARAIYSGERGHNDHSTSNNNGNNAGSTAASSNQPPPNIPSSATVNPSQTHHQARERSNDSSRSNSTLHTPAATGSSSSFSLNFNSSRGSSGEIASGSTFQVRSESEVVTSGSVPAAPSSSVFPSRMRSRRVASIFTSREPQGENVYASDQTNVSMNENPYRTERLP